MKTIFITTALTLLSFNTLAGTLPQTKAEFCERFEDSPEAKEVLQDLSTDSVNLMAFKNDGGLFNGGVCWWHSRFQRNALYLTIYKPHLPRPSLDEARELIKQIREAKDVIVIPGFRNFSEFSSIHEAQIQRELEKWQKGDGVIRFAWVKGLSGTSSVASDELKNIMDQLYEEVEVKKNIAYNKLQFPGVVAHAWLVVHMEKVNGGYNLEILDSNFPRSTETYRYREGDSELNYQGYYKFTPYLERTNEMDRIHEVIKKKCSDESVEKLARR